MIYSHFHSKNKSLTYVMKSFDIFYELENCPIAYFVASNAEDISHDEESILAPLYFSLDPMLQHFLEASIKWRTNSVKLYGKLSEFHLLKMYNFLFLMIIMYFPFNKKLTAGVWCLGIVGCHGKFIRSFFMQYKLVEY